MLRDLYNEKTANIAVKSGDHIFIEDSSANIKTTTSIIDKDGNVAENVGKVRAAGRTLSELKMTLRINATSAGLSECIPTSNHKLCLSNSTTNLPRKAWSSDTNHR